jgi:hypothetical protein
MNDADPSLAPSLPPDPSTTLGTVAVTLLRDGTRLSLVSGEDSDLTTEAVAEALAWAEIQCDAWFWAGEPSPTNDRTDGRAEVVVRLNRSDEQPTHRIAFLPKGETTPRLFLVLLEGWAFAEGGVRGAYDHTEWTEERAASWCVSHLGQWRHEGQVTPGGANGTVTVTELHASKPGG